VPSGHNCNDISYRYVSESVLKLYELERELVGRIFCSQAL
jgi:hypothetical protein